MQLMPCCSVKAIVSSESAACPHGHDCTEMPYFSYSHGCVSLAKVQGPGVAPSGETFTTQKEQRESGSCLP